MFYYFSNPLMATIEFVFPKLKLRVFDYDWNLLSFKRHFFSFRIVSMKYRKIKIIIYQVISCPSVRNWIWPYIFRTKKKTVFLCVGWALALINMKDFYIKNVIRWRKYIKRKRSDSLNIRKIWTRRQWDRNMRIWGND